MTKQNQGNKTKLFGRNSFTLIFVFGVVVVLFLIIATITSYVTTGQQGDVTPFVTQDGDNVVPEDMSNVTYMDGKDFNDFAIEFHCSKYEADAKSASFYINTYKTDTTESIGITKFDAKLCLAADWVGFIKYSSAQTSRSVGTLTNKTKSTFTVKLIDFPAKANTWPIPVTVDSPDAYLYITFSFKKNGEDKTKTYLLKYTYSEFNIELGGIPR